MNKIWKIFQYGYLVVAAICLIEGVLRFNENRETAILLLVFSVFITIVFLFKRRFRKKVEERNKQGS